MHHRYKGYIFVYTRSYTYYVGGMIHEKMYKVVFLKKLFRTSRTIYVLFILGILCSILRYRAISTTTPPYFYFTTITMT